MKELRLVKRYQNQKLYDTLESCYVTLSEMGEFIRRGDEIQVIDNKTKSDITYKTVIQILCDAERTSLTAFDSAFQNRVIRSEEGTLAGYIRTLEGNTSSGAEFHPLEAIDAENSVSVNLQ